MFSIAATAVSPGTALMTPPAMWQYAISSHSITGLGTPDGITYDKADTLTGTAESLQLWEDSETNLKHHFQAGKK